MDVVNSSQRSGGGGAQNSSSQFSQHSGSQKLDLDTPHKNGNYGGISMEGIQNFSKGDYSQPRKSQMNKDELIHQKMRELKDLGVSAEMILSKHNFIL